MSTYRVRDRNWSTIWGENLSLEDAQRLKEKVTGSGKSRTARVEPMDVRPPGSDEDLSVPSDGVPISVPVDGVSYELADLEEHTATARGVLGRVPPGTELLVNGEALQVPAIIEPGDRIQARVIDSALAKAHELARAAVRAAALLPRRNRPVPLDVTVRQPKPRTVPVPPDRTVRQAPRTVRLGAPPVAAPKVLPSPLKVAMQPFPEPAPGPVMGDDDLGDLTADLGGQESQDDLDHAKREAK